MKETAKVFRALMWVVLVFSVACHGLTVFAVIMNNQQATEQDQADLRFAPELMYAGLALLIAGAVLTAVWRKRPWVGVAVLAVAGVLLAFNTVRLGEYFPVSITAAGEERGLTTAKLLLRHWSAELIPLFAAIAWLLESLPAWRHVPLAEILPESEIPEGDRPAGSVFLRCSRCDARFFNSANEAVFTCPYCRKKLGMPGKNWDGLKKKRSLRAKERKAAQKAEAPSPAPEENS